MTDTQHPLANALINAFIATRTPAAKKTPDWCRVRQSLECSIFAEALSIIFSQYDALDPATVEHCAKIAETRWKQWTGESGVECDVTACENIAAAIRASTGDKS